MKIRMLGVAITLCLAWAQVVQAQPVFYVQVNTDVLGHDILGDAGNEPSIAVDPTNPNRMIGSVRNTRLNASRYCANSRMQRSVSSEIAQLHTAFDLEF